MSHPISVPIVDDSENDALLMVDTLEQWEFDVKFERVWTASAMNDTN